MSEEAYHPMRKTNLLICFMGFSKARARNIHLTSRDIRLHQSCKYSKGNNSYLRKTVQTAICEIFFFFLLILLFSGLGCI